jgi:hypothetical protein
MKVIDSVLKSAGWVKSASQIEDIEVEGAGVTYDTGVEAHIAPEEIGTLEGVLRILVASLTAEGLPAAAHTNPQLSGKTPKLINVRDRQEALTPRTAVRFVFIAFLFVSSGAILKSGSANIRSSRRLSGDNRNSKDRARQRGIRSRRASLARGFLADGPRRAQQGSRTACSRLRGARGRRLPAAGPRLRHLSDSVCKISFRTPLILVENPLKSA